MLGLRVCTTTSSRKCTLIILALRRLRQEDDELHGNLDYIASKRPSGLHEILSEKKKKEREGKPGMMVNTRYPSTWEVETGGPGFSIVQGYIESLKTTNQERTRRREGKKCNVI